MGLRDFLCAMSSSEAPKKAYLGVDTWVSAWSNFSPREAEYGRSGGCLDPEKLQNPGAGSHGVPTGQGHGILPSPSLPSWLPQRFRL